MKPTDQLKEDHRTIETVLDILERMCEQFDAGDAVNPDHLDRVLEFFKVFADRYHHGKEETVLFPAMEKAGFSREHGPLAVMLMEHTTGRGYVSELGEAIKRYRESNGRDATQIARPARNYIALLRDHIAKEDEVLFPMAEEHLQGPVERELLSAFERIERETLGTADQVNFQEMFKELKSSYRTKRSGAA